jgi:hypothetical protein
MYDEGHWLHNSGETVHEHVLLNIGIFPLVHSTCEARQTNKKRNQPVHSSLLLLVNGIDVDCTF